MPEKDIKEVSRQAREYYDKGVTALQRNNFDHAVHYLIQTLKLEPGFLKARQLLRAAEIKKLKAGGGSTISKIFGSMASSPALAMGNVKKDPKKAMETAEETLIKNPSNLQALRLLADAAEAMELFATAIDAYETARQNSPDNTAVLMELGRLYQLNGQADKGRDCYERVYELEPSNSEAFKGLKDATANAAMQKGKWETAESYRDMIKDVGEAQSLEQAGRIFKDEEVVHAQMQDVYRQAQEQPENVSLWKKLGDLAMQRNDFDYAFQNYQHAFELTHGVDVSLEKAMADTRIKKIKFLILQKEDELLADPNNTAIQEAIVALKQEQESTILQECESRAKRYPNDLDIRYDLARIYYRRGEIDKAIPEFQLAANNPKNKIACTNWLGACFREKGMFDMAIMRFISAAEQAIVMDNLKKEILYNLGSTYEQMGEKEKMIEQYKLIYDVDVTYRDVSKKIEDYYKDKGSKG